MTIDGNTIVWASALVVAVAIIAGAVWKFAKRDVSADNATAKLATVDTHATRLTAVETRLALMEQAAATHAAGDIAAFSRIEHRLESMNVSVDEMKETLTELAVASRLKGRADRGVKET